jgi:soluble lytic murein transglycosylase-like protein
MKYDAEVSAAVSQTRTRYGIALDPALVHAIIQKETLHGSLPITGTLEPDGHYSYGPMQVKDTTGAMHGISDPLTLAVPSIGIRIGTFELARLMQLFPGDTARAVAAYNAGSGHAVRNAAGHFPNQSYVDAVLGFWRQYQGAVLGGGAALLALLALLFVTLRRRLSRR